MADNKNETKLSSLSEQERSDAFKAWFLNTATKEDGGGYGKNTYGAYFTALNTFSKQLKERGLYERGVFEIFEDSEIDELIEVFKNNQELQEFFKARNESSNVASGLAQYKKFLLYKAGFSGGAISSAQIKNLRNEFKDYLSAKYPDKNEGWVSVRWSDTFYALNNDVGVNFWSCLIDEETLFSAEPAIASFIAKAGRKTGTPENSAKYHISLMREFKEFLDTKHPTLAKEWSDKTTAEVIMIDYNLVTAEHIKEALDYITENGTPTNRESRTRYLVYKDKRYAPKYVFAVAYTIPIGKDKSEAESVMNYTTNQILPTLRKFSDSIGYEIILENDTPQARKEAFGKWLSSQFINGKDGKKYTVVTANDYSGHTNRFFKKFTGDGILPDIFEYSVAEEFRKACDTIKERHIDEYEKINSETKNGMIKYHAFLVSCENEDDSEMDNTNELVKFKELLAWFVKQLRINNGFEEGKKIYGKGDTGDNKIRSLYKNWRSFDGFTLDCTFQVKFGNNATKANYINMSGTWVNIVPHFSEDKTNVESLQVSYRPNNVDKSDHEIVLIAALGLDGDSPNEVLAEFFACLKNEIAKYGQENPTGAITLSNMTGENIIFYGVPGSGKSYSICGRVGEIVENKKLAEADAKRIYETLAKTKNIWKVVFHPDYTYSDFTGQILPMVEDGKVKYEFKPGPFTSILKLAIQRPNEPFILIIEEINRGNSAAIFGDVFQLLDRIEDNTNEHALEKIIKSNKYPKFFTEEKEENISNNKFNSNRKNEIFINNAINNINLCAICGGALHASSISFDHIIDKKDGGTGDATNGQITHHYCNTTYKNSGTI